MSISNPDDWKVSKMKLRTARKEEFESIRNFYWNLIDQMKNRNGIIGWKKGIYPEDDFLRDSI